MRTHLPWSATLAEYEAAAAATSRDAVARAHEFRDWDALVATVSAIADTTSPVHRFERASEAVVTGDVETLRALLREHPELVRARSARITSRDPAVHGATLVHYLAANGVESYRQKSPGNAVQVARVLFEAGADPDAVAWMYGGECATMSMLTSSTPPHVAGTQVPLVHALLDAGASPDRRGTGHWQSPVNTALIFGFADAADALVSRGARIDDLVTAAGMGRTDLVAAWLPAAPAPERQRALVLASKANRLDTVRQLLDAGEDPNRLNPDGMHAHSTILHQAALDGHLALVQLLVSRGARADIADTIWHGTPLGWAEHGGQQHIVDWLRTLPPVSADGT